MTQPQANQQPDPNRAERQKQAALQGKQMPSNQILVIAPYWLESAETWVFDDEAFDIVQEPFVQGMPEMIDDLVVNLPNAKNGFRLLFSAAPFPNADKQLLKLRKECGGTWYQDTETKKEGWLCAVLFKYYKTAPDVIYVKAESKG